MSKGKKVCVREKKFYCKSKGCGGRLVRVPGIADAKPVYVPKCERCGRVYLRATEAPLADMRAFNRRLRESC